MAAGRTPRSGMCRHYYCLWTNGTIIGPRDGCGACLTIKINTPNHHINNCFVGRTKR